MIIAVWYGASCQVAKVQCSQMYVAPVLSYMKKKIMHITKPIANLDSL
jgi:hypothetical protein